MGVLSLKVIDSLRAKIFSLQKHYRYKREIYDFGEVFVQDRATVE